MSKSKTRENGGHTFRHAKIPGRPFPHPSCILQIYNKLIRQQYPTRSKIKKNKKFEMRTSL